MTHSPSSNQHADDDSPSVIGTDVQRTMPTPEDLKAAYRRLFVARFVELGVPEHVGEAEFDAAPWDDIKDMDPDLAADVAMEVWDVE